MNSRNWVRLFVSTLLIGAAAGMITGLIVEAKLYKNFVDFLALGIWLFGVSCIFSLISQMGFFAYLTIHRFGLGMFRSVKLWNAVQIVLIAFVLFDLVYLRYTAFAEKGDAIAPYFIPAAILTVIGLAVAYLKQRETNREAFIPALFFMVVVTTIEWFPVLKANDFEWVTIMFVALVVSNAWQIMLLHRLNANSKKSPQL
ncbi:KinB-signaling pathway activation protein [Pueribacillus theae]|uniref:KinB-signaling pathway activation protein n=1 Tax=Pueribacillus theae TaxID=2171751 RepID=A0A2U1K6S0_9BACI|nr:KinB-signaling pathway activation protein [Pueribacillus theae]PWA12869.1 KinB-signaling pathway activation protein [Pueribacillus theae]